MQSRDQSDERMIFGLFSLSESKGLKMLLILDSLVLQGPVVCTGDEVCWQSDVVAQVVVLWIDSMCLFICHFWVDQLD